MTTPAALLEGIYSEGRDFSSRGQIPATPSVQSNPGYHARWCCIVREMPTQLAFEASRCALYDLY